MRLRYVWLCVPYRKILDSRYPYIKLDAAHNVYLGQKGYCIQDSLQELIVMLRIRCNISRALAPTPVMAESAIDKVAALLTPENIQYFL